MAANKAKNKKYYPLILKLIRIENSQAIFTETLCGKEERTKELIMKPGNSIAFWVKEGE